MVGEVMSGLVIFCLDDRQADFMLSQLEGILAVQYGAWEVDDYYLENY